MKLEFPGYTTKTEYHKDGIWVTLTPKPGIWAWMQRTVWFLKSMKDRW